KPTSMITGVLYEYKEHLYWLKRELIICLGVGVAFGIVAWGVGALFKINKHKVAKGLKIVTVMVAGIILLVWLLRKGYTSFHYTSYDPIYHPSVGFLVLAFITCGIVFVLKRSSKEEKLLCMLIVMVLFITPLGSNNGSYQAFNNLFLAAPFVLAKIWDFFKTDYFKKKITEYPVWALRGGIGTLLIIFFVQIWLFGAKFVFAEATGIQDAKTISKEVPALRGTLMQSERAEEMDDLYIFLESKNCLDKEVILMGDIPSLSFYLGMAPAFNPWPDLLSYDQDIFMKTLVEIIAESRTGKDDPVIIVDSKFWKDITRERVLKEYNDTFIAKTEALEWFISIKGYSLSYESDKFMVYLGK
ncbi:MAG: hypothetical protein K6F84_03085, partial [Lachnospiraceae bacterium]|nr:hypothetical protein [Lachnospiraceae bacterium]